MKCSVDCIVYLPYILLWGDSLHQILYTIGSRSPHTKRIGRNWMAPLSFVLFSPPPEPRIFVNREIHNTMALNLNLGEAYEKKITKTKTYSEVLSFWEHNDKYISARFPLYGGSEDKTLLKKHTDPPTIYACYYSDSPTLSHSFAIEYDDHSLIYRLKNSTDNFRGMLVSEWLKRFDQPASRIVITIDGRETISLNQNVRSESSGNGLATFPIGQDDFLKCCNANQLKFEIFKGGESVIDFFDNEKDNILMIEHCRVLYNYVVDDSMFPEALPKLLQRKKSESRRDVIGDVVIIGKVTIIFVLIVLFFLWAIQH